MITICPDMTSAVYQCINVCRAIKLGSGYSSGRNDITTLALYGHGSEAILFFSMWQGKVIHFPIIIWFYKHFL